ncbi:MAG: OFA family MFS transporter [Candidatus Bathyarchaeia archaeon]
MADLQENNCAKAKLFGFSPEKGRWLLVVAGLIIELCLGAIYSYSIISVPLKRVFENPPPQGLGLKVTATEMQIPFIAFLLIFALAMPMVGKFIDKYSPRKVAVVGSVFVGLGWFLASFANSPSTLVFLYGVIGGLGVGIVYNCPITTAAKWFPDKRGLAVGLTVLGFGFSAAIIAPFSDFLAANFGVHLMFQTLGILFFLLILIFALFLRLPPANWKPEGWTMDQTKAATKAELARNDMIKTKSFYALWICYTIGTLAGLMAIGVSKPVGLEVAGNAGISELEISSVLTALAIPFAFCNGFGRPLFGWVTDKITPLKTAILSFILIFIASALVFTNPASIPVYAISFAILWLNLGGWLAIAPAATASFFGVKDYARNYGLVFTAYGAGAVIGNTLAGQARDLFGAYVMVFPYVMVLAALGIVISLIGLKPPKTK